MNALRALFWTCILLTLCLCASAAADPAPPSDQALRRQIREVLREHPELILEALEGLEAELYDAVQRGLEAKREARLLRRRQDQARKPLGIDLDASRPFLGNRNAPETVVVFTDLQFPDCATGYAELQKLMRGHPGRFRIAFRHRPMGFHDHSEAAARHFEAALLQDEDRAFDYLGMLFREQRRVFQEGVPAMEGLAAEAGLDVERLRRDAGGPAVKQRVENDLAYARELGFTAAPVAVLRGVVITGAKPPSAYLEVLEMAGGAAQKP
ncbi:MAG: DsbA family protein [Desulfovibrionaceae bacterium]